jgi:antitoxin component YwqK of YwqJK toxin-antitoxin module
MKIFSLLALSCLTMSIGFSQTTNSGFTNRNEAKNQTINGLKEGKWVEYKYDEGGPTTDTNASVYTLTIYKAGKPDGMVRMYYKHQLVSESPYVKGVKNGVEIDYYDKGGALQQKMPYVDGKRNGIDTGYYKDGKIMSIATYKDDTYDGTMKSYYENGTLKSEWPYQQGKLNGTKKDYSETGILIKETPFVNNSETGVEKDYSDKGIIQKEITYASYVRDGAEKYYYPDGKLQAVETYDHNKKVSVIYYQEDGSVIKQN